MMDMEDDTGVAGDDNEDREEMEIALYSQIHFEENMEELLQDEDRGHYTGVGSFNFNVAGNLKTGYKPEVTSAEYVLNKSIEDKYNTEDIADKDPCTCTMQDVKNSSKFETDLKKMVTQSVKLAVQQKDSTKRDLDKEKGIEHVKKVSIITDKSLTEKLILGLHCNLDGSTSDSVDSNMCDSESDGDSVYAVIGEHGDDDDIQINMLTDQLSSLKERNIPHKVLVKTSDRKDWKINKSDSQHGAGQRSRYYKPIRCNNCNEVGHLSKNCPKPKKQQTCSFCSESGHIMRACPQSTCYNCDEPGHDAKKCQYPRRSWYTVCFRCRMQGHEQSRCPDQWRQYHLTIMPGKIQQGKIKKRTVRYCYNCTGDDHYGHECDEDRMSRYVRVATPFVCRYQSVREMEHLDVSCDKMEEKTRKQIQLDKKKLSPFVTIKGKTHENYQNGRNNFDKMQFTVLIDRQKADISASIDPVKSAKKKGKKHKKNKEKGSKGSRTGLLGKSLERLVDNNQTEGKFTAKVTEKKFDTERRKSASLNRNVNLEEDYPRGNNNHDRSADLVNLNQDELFSLKEIRTMKRRYDNTMEADDDDVEHQVWDNEWWNKKSSKKKRCKKSKKSASATDIVIEID